MKLTDELVRAHWRVLGGNESAVPLTFLVMVISWLMATFASFGLYAPRNSTVLSVLLIASLSVAAAIFMILELDSPFGGLIRVSGEPFRYVLAHLGK